MAGKIIGGGESEAVVRDAEADASIAIVFAKGKTAKTPDTQRRQAAQAITPPSQQRSGNSLDDSNIAFSCVPSPLLHPL
jgi:hypothetical protein